MGVMVRRLNANAWSSELTTGEYEDVSERDMEILYENLEVLCEDLGGGEWEVEYSVRPLLHLLDGLTPPPPPSSSSLIVVLLSAITLLRLGLVEMAPYIESRAVR